MAPPDHSFDASPLGRTSRLADGVFGALRMARALAAAGRPVDIRGLDRMTGLLCAKSLDLLPEDGRRMRVTLIALLAEVDALSRTLHAASPPAVARF